MNFSFAETTPMKNARKITIPSPFQPMFIQFCENKEPSDVKRVEDEMSVLEEPLSDIEPRSKMSDLQCEESLATTQYTIV
jgi:hypothetical protein